MDELPNLILLVHFWDESHATLKYILYVMIIFITVSATPVPTTKWINIHNPSFSQWTLTTSRIGISTLKFGILNSHIREWYTYIILHIQKTSSSIPSSKFRSNKMLTCCLNLKTPPLPLLDLPKFYWLKRFSSY